MSMHTRSDAAVTESRPIVREEFER